jgi:hypothetical protein
MQRSQEAPAVVASLILYRFATYIKRRTNSAINQKQAQQEKNVS